MIEVLLFDSIPTTDFLRQENDRYHTASAKELWQAAKLNNCRYVVPNLLFPHINPIYEVNSEIKGARDVIHVTQNMPLALQMDTEFESKDDIYDMAKVIGLVPYYCDYLDLKQRIDHYEPSS